LQCRKLLNNHRKVTADAEYKAVYRIKGSSEGGVEGAAYLITWCDEDGTVLKKDAVVAGTILEYKGEEPKKEGFAFAGWNSEIVTAVKDMESCKELEFCILPIAAAHLECLKDLPWIHRDPFDRLLVSQAAAEDLTIVTVDGNISKYDIKTIWT
jgi:hypothetical protein